MSNPHSNVENPFQKLSSVFIENQRNFNINVNDLVKRLERLNEITRALLNQLNSDPFTAKINMLTSIEEESKFILSTAKDLEKKREDITSILKLLENTNELKLNK